MSPFKPHPAENSNHLLQYTCGILIKIVFVQTVVAIFSKRWLTGSAVCGWRVVAMGSIIDGCPIIALMIRQGDGREQQLTVKFRRQSWLCIEIS
jgi:hypothetical protein